MTLAERLAQVRPVQLEVDAYRQQSPGHDPRSGAGARQAGGRFNPPQSFPVLYLALSVETAAAELRRQAEAIGVTLDDALPRELFRYHVALTDVLDLTHPDVLQALEVTADQILADDRQVSRAIGEDALAAGFQAILAPSATDHGAVLAVLAPNLGSGTITVEPEGRWESAADVPE